MIPKTLDFSNSMMTVAIIFALLFMIAVYYARKIQAQLDKVRVWDPKCSQFYIRDCPSSQVNSELNNLKNTTHSSKPTQVLLFDLLLQVPRVWFGTCEKGTD